jgi:heme-degrading monooxygenase HmoA
MFVILWEFEVKPGSEQSFESAYGPEGAWVQLFRRDPGYLRTLLLKDPFRPPTYLTLDFWHSESAFQSFRNANHEALSGPRSLYGRTRLPRDAPRFVHSNSQFLCLKQHPDQPIRR